MQQDAACTTLTCHVVLGGGRRAAARPERVVQPIPHAAAALTGASQQPGNGKVSDSIRVFQPYEA